MRRLGHGGVWAVRRTAFFAAFGLVAACAASAGVNTWTTSGPPGGGVSVIADPRAAGVLYAGSSNGLFKSTDNGATWFSVGLGGQQTSPLAMSERNGVRRRQLLPGSERLRGNAL